MLKPRGLQTTAREAISSGPQSLFVNNEKVIHLWKICWFGRMQHFTKQSHYVRCPALELLCNILCSPLTKKFGDPCFGQWYNSKWDTIDGCQKLPCFGTALTQVNVVGSLPGYMKECWQ